eukprot:scpid108746/ scgid32604/ 
MAETDSVNAQAKTKCKVLKAQVKLLEQRSTEATTLLLVSAMYSLLRSRKGDKEKKKHDEEYVLKVAEIITGCNDQFAQLQGSAASQSCTKPSSQLPVKIIDLTKIMAEHTKTQEETAKLLNKFAIEQGATK